MNVRDPDRDRRMAEMHLTGCYTLAEIGELEGGISGERVRQILRRCGVTLEQSREAGRLARMVDLTCEACGAHFQRSAARAQRSAHHACSLVCLRIWNGRRMAAAAWTDAELLEQLRELAALVDRTPSWRDVNAYGPPSHMTYVKRFGSIRNAQTAAGLKPNRINADRSTWGGR